MCQDIHGNVLPQIDELVHCFAIVSLAALVAQLHLQRLENSNNQLRRYQQIHIKIFFFSLLFSCIILRWTK